MHFLFASDADADVRRATDSQFGVVQETDGVYLVHLRTGQKTQIMRPVPLDFDFKKVETLSRRERQVFAMLGDARTMNEIASQMAVSVKTAETYRARIREKLDVASGLQVLRIATEWKLLRRTESDGKPSELADSPVSGSMQ